MPAKKRIKHFEKKHSPVLYKKRVSLEKMYKDYIRNRYLCARFLVEKRKDKAF